MTDGHPLVWLLLLLTGSTIALNTTNPLLLLVMVGALVATGFIAAGPRRASLVTALGIAFVAALFWVIVTLLLPRGAAADAVIVLPSWSPGPGVTLGGPLDLGSVVTGLVGALKAAVVIMLFGVAGQLVSARGWLALSRSTLGAGSPALHPIATLGEASVEALHVRHRLARQGWGRAASADWLTTLLIAGRDIARTDRATSRTRPVVELLRVAGLMLLVAGPVLALAFGVVPAVVTANLYGSDILGLTVVLAVMLGLVLPGTPPLLWDMRATDVPQLAVAVLLVAGWAGRDLLDQANALTPTADTITALPWAIAGAVVLLPVAVALTGTRAPRRAELAHA